MLLTEIYLSNNDLKFAEKEINILINKYAGFSNVDRVIYSLALKIYEKNPLSAQNYFNILQNKYPDSIYSVKSNIIYGNLNFEKNTILS